MDTMQMVQKIEDQLIADSGFFVGTDYIKMAIPRIEGELDLYFSEIETRENVGWKRFSAEEVAAYKENCPAD